MSKQRTKMVLAVRTSMKTANKDNPAGVAPASKSSVRRNRCGGFTLIEALIALALMIALLSMAYGFYANTLRVRHEGNKVARDVMMARAILSRIVNEIRHATDIVPGDGRGFQGTEHSIQIVYLAAPELRQAFTKFDSMRTDLPPAQLDIRRSTYELLWDEELVDEDGKEICHGMWRTEQKTFDPNPKFVLIEEKLDAEAVAEQEQEKEKKDQTQYLRVGELIAPEIKFIRFEYYDGAQWHDRWRVAYETDTGEPGGLGEGDGKKGSEDCPECDKDENGDDGSDYVLPQAVKITLGRVKVPRDDEEYDINMMDETEERLENKEHHPDRFTIVVYLRQADQSLLSSRKYGASRSDQLLGRQDGW